ncbi:MAG: transporter substrate-binding domain-containing protein [Thalassovita sp.]|nr:transporter substrate-binding domain-containing protein [Thalassovita sp.]
MTDSRGDLRRAVAPKGTLRAALNHGNRILVTRDAAGNAQGITVDLARALADRLGLPLEFIHKDRAIDVSSVAQDDVYDICFLAVDPERAKTIHFTAPYVQIEGAYLVGAHCDTTDAHTLVSEGHRVATVDGSAYTLNLSRKPGAEHLVHFPSIQAALDALDKGEVAAVAGIKAVMEREGAKRAGSRVVGPPFMQIRQAMGMPTGRPDAARFLDEVVADMARSGRVGDILERHGVSASCAILPD